MYIDILYQCNRYQNQDRLDEAHNLRVARLVDERPTLAGKALLVLAGGLISAGTRLQSAVRGGSNMQTHPC